MLYPLIFKPRLVEKIWGGHKIQTLLGKDLPPGKTIGESWELYDFPPGIVDDTSQWVSSEIANGPLAGQTLHQAIQHHGQALLGNLPLLGPHGQFPVLIKFLDARENLSVQVHPGPGYAAAHPEAHLKTEAWYVIQSENNSRIYKGLTPGTTRADLARALAGGTVEQMLNSVPAQPGQTFYLPSGTVHALGEGILVAEVQTPSDTTFRLYDFNRIDASTGRPRTLHIDQALECIDYTGHEPAQRRSHVAGFFTTVTRLVNCPHFRIEKVRFVEGVQEPLPYDQPAVWIVLEGAATLRVADLAEPVSLTPGQTVLLPATMANPVIHTHSDCAWLEVSFPSSPQPE